MAGASSPNVAIRLGTTGLDDVKADLASFGDAGDASTQRLVNGFNRASAAADAAAERAQAAGAKVAAALGAASSNGQSFSVGPDQSAQVQAYNAFLADQARKAEALRNAIDPLRVAQKAYDDEIAAARGLLASRTITEEEYAASVRRSGQALDEAKRQLGEGAEGYNKLGAAGLVADHVVRSFSDSVAAGQSPIRAIQMEFPRVVEGLNLWAMQSGETEGRMGKLASFMGGPWGLALTLGVTALGPLITELFKTDDAAAKAAAQGLKAFEDRQKELPAYIDATTGKLREQYRAVIALNAIQTPAAIQGKATETQGFTNQAFATARAALTAAGHSRAGPNDTDLSRAILDAGSNSDLLSKNISALAARRPDLAGLANTVGDLAGKAHDGAVEIQRMQGSLAQQNDALHGAKILNADVVQGMVDRATATDRVTAANLHLQDVQAKVKEVSAEPYSATQQAQLQQLATDEIAASKAVDAARKAETDAAAAAREHTKAMNEAQRAAEAYARSVAEMWTKLDRSGTEGTKKIADATLETANKDVAKLQEEQVAQDVGRGAYAAKTLAAQIDAQKLSEADLATTTMSTAQRERYLAIVKATVDAQKSGSEVTAEELDTIIAGVPAQEALNDQIRRGAAAMEEIRGFTSGLIDDLAQGKLKASDLLQEFIKLAALNPLKNLLGGTHSTTLTDVIGAATSLLGGGFSASKVAAGTTAALSNLNLTANLPAIGHNAAGTDYWSGGLTWAGENGPELINLPRGTGITPAGQSRQMAAANDAGGDTHIHVYAQDAVLADTVRGWVRAGVEEAATRGAYGGARLARSNDVRRQARTIAR